MDTPELAPLRRMSDTTPTDFWNDSCSVEELTYAIERGAVGATTNPTIVLSVLKKEMRLWKDRIGEMIHEDPMASEAELSIRLMEEMAVSGAKLLEPVYEREKRRKGRLSIQTNPQFYRNAEAIVSQAVLFHALAPNMQVKIPVTRAGVIAIEEATARGVNVNATVCFTIPQCLAVAEAVERGLARRQAQGEGTGEMSPVCTMMVGRLDDWLGVVAQREGVLATPGVIAWSGVACFKKCYSIFRARGYHARLLAAAYRHELHWTEFIGGDVVLTMPYEWQKRFNASDLEVVERMERPVDDAIVDELYRKFADFRRAYDEKGMPVEAFDTYGATARTLRAFIGSLHDLMAVVRDFMLPNPDLAAPA